MTEARRDIAYSLKVSTVIDFEESTEVHFFNSLFEAQNMFKKLVQEAESNVVKPNWVITKDKNYYCAYEDGSYSENRVTAIIEKKSLDD